MLVSLMMQFLVATIPVETPVTWVGLDFSMARMADHDGFREPSAIFPGYLQKWNSLFLKEQMDSLERVLGRRVQPDVSAVNERNRKARSTQIVDHIADDGVASRKALEQAVRSLKLSATAGIGLGFFVDSMDKPREQACMHAVFFDVASRRIMSSELQCASPRGFGFRNYWFGAIKAVVAALGAQAGVVTRNGGE